jgi:hypothetical protein
MKSILGSVPLVSRVKATTRPPPNLSKSSEVPGCSLKSAIQSGLCDDFNASRIWILGLVQHESNRSQSRAYELALFQQNKGWLTLAIQQGDQESRSPDYASTFDCKMFHCKCQPIVFRMSPDRDNESHVGSIIRVQPWALAARPKFIQDP